MLTCHLLRRVVAAGESIHDTQAQVDSFFKPEPAGANGAPIAGVELHDMQGEVVDELQPASEDDAGAVINRHSGAFKHPFEVVGGVVREVLSTGVGTPATTRK